VVLVKEYEGAGDWLDIVFWGGFICASMAYAVGIYMFVRSFYGYVYQHLPFPSELQRYRDGLRDHHRGAGTPYLADREFEAFMERNLVNAADHNMEHNLNRGTYLHRANSAIIIALVALAFTSVPYSILERNQADRPQRIEITRMPGATMPQSAVPAMSRVPPRPIPPSNIDERAGLKAPPPLPQIVSPGPVPPSNFEVRTGVRAPKPK
jgi:hypothetical protein